MRILLRVREIAEQQGMSVEALAFSANVEITLVHYIFEAQNAEGITLDTLLRIANALDTTINKLIVDAV